MLLFVVIEARMHTTFYTTSEPSKNQTSMIVLVTYLPPLGPEEPKGASMSQTLAQASFTLFFLMFTPSRLENWDYHCTKGASNPVLNNTAMCGRLRIKKKWVQPGHTENTDHRLPRFPLQEGLIGVLQSFQVWQIAVASIRVEGDAQRHQWRRLDWCSRKLMRFAAISVEGYAK